MKCDGEPVRQGDLGTLFWMVGNVEKEILMFAGLNAYKRIEGRW